MKSSCVTQIIVLLSALCCGASGEQVSVDVLQEREIRPWAQHQADYVFRFENAERIDFAALPTLYLFRYVSHWLGDEQNLYLFAVEAGEGQMEVLLDATGKMPGEPPAFAGIETVDGGSEAMVRVHSRFHGQGNYWGREAFRYTGDRLERVEELARMGGQRFSFNEKEQQYDTLHPVEWEGATVLFRKEEGSEGE